MFKKINDYWQAQDTEDLKKKKKKRIDRFWSIFKLAIRVGYWIWKLLTCFF